ncbi:MAG: hypothetical protein ABIR11_08215, partial [Candidatus Limnocylindrales bacterium]
LGQATVRLRVTDLPDDLGSLGTFGEVTLEEDWLVVRPIDPERIPELVATLVRLGARVHAVDPGRRSLEDLFLGLVRDGETAATGGPASTTPDASRR